MRPNSFDASLWVRSAPFTGLLFAPRFSVRVAGVPVLLEQPPSEGLPARAKGFSPSRSFVSRG